MKLIRTTLIAAASLITAVAGVHAQSGTSQAEMNRGVPDVDVDVGRNADGAIDVNRANTERARGVPGVDADAGRNADGAIDVNTANTNDRDAAQRQEDTTTYRPARADRG